MGPNVNTLRIYARVVKRIKLLMYMRHLDFRSFCIIANLDHLPNQESEGQPLRHVREAKPLQLFQLIKHIGIHFNDGSLLGARR